MLRMQQVTPDSMFQLHVGVRVQILDRESQGPRHVPIEAPGARLTKDTEPGQ